MNKEEFIRELREGLNGIPEAEKEESIRFYSEMIDDMTEEGLSEEEAVARIGSAGDIAEQIRREYPKTSAEEKKAKPKSAPNGSVNPDKIEYQKAFLLLLVA